MEKVTFGKRTLTIDPDVIKKADTFFSAAYIAYTCAELYSARANELFATQGLVARELKQATNQLDHAFDRYDRAIHQLMSQKNANRSAHEFEACKKIFDQVLGIKPEMWN